jgi:predicted glycosyltransferase
MSTSVRRDPGAPPGSRPALAEKNGCAIRPVGRKGSRPKKIWIDLENSPHVPFFKPIIDELERRGYTVVLTARDCFQVCDLADLFGLRYRLIGHHYGKHKIAKLAGLGIRALQLAPYALREKPDLALSHGSRTQFLISLLLKIPTITISDYEHVSWMAPLHNSWVMAPEVIPRDALQAIGYKEDRILSYPGIKEDVYAPSFRPDASIRQRLACSDQDVVVTIRPPATEAHYHNPESDKLLDAVFEIVSKRPDVKVVLLPRTPLQEAGLRKQWPELFKTGRIIVPAQAIDGLGVIWCSDLVISGGGTMNREAAAMGVPVYSIFRGKIGAVDRHLSDQGRMVLLETVEDIRTKIKAVRRQRSEKQISSENSPALKAIVQNIEAVLDVGSSGLAARRD